MNKEKNEERKIEVADNIPGAEYANAMQVMHTREEFQLTFLNIFGLSGRTVAKVISGPAHYKRMLSALTENLKKYEESFGPIEDAEQTPKEGGFKARFANK